MNLDRYSNLKEQCYICNISGATKKDCANCPKKSVIQQYEDEDTMQRKERKLMRVKDLTSALSEKDGASFEILSNSILELAEGAEAPDSVMKWCEALIDETSSLIYLSRIGDCYGALAINEYDDVTCKNIFSDNKIAMRAEIQKIAKVLADSAQMKDFQVYIGKETGFAGCDEIGVLIPFDTPLENARVILSNIDANVYPSQVMEQRAKENESYIKIPIFSEEPDEFGEYQIVGYRKEYV